ncbi:hypothetical protein GA0070624_3451 [Micromonospora rhizosphaerae]|uniref:Uncharacterized protein n=1 Tax=Micromonospora rhizosphaerae TaxID=568872 RepID=A0A1C6SCJ3_9ACTN|nr:hypothetical protein [Micromonospora rhizosphaerae]SCL27189.1 hypothetical protein GA0070624_3451 [Micromonospora rhizosphaerae]
MSAPKIDCPGRPHVIGAPPGPDDAEVELEYDDVEGYVEDGEGVAPVVDVQLPEHDVEPDRATEAEEAAGDEPQAEAETDPCPEAYLDAGEPETKGDE